MKPTFIAESEQQRFAAMRAGLMPINLPVVVKKPPYGFGFNNGFTLTSRSFSAVWPDIQCSLHHILGSLSQLWAFDEVRDHLGSIDEVAAEALVGELLAQFAGWAGKLKKKEDNRDTLDSISHVKKRLVDVVDLSQSELPSEPSLDPDAVSKLLCHFFCQLAELGDALPDFLALPIGRRVVERLLAFFDEHAASSWGARLPSRPDPVDATYFDSLSLYALYEKSLAGSSVPSVARESGGMSEFEQNRFQVVQTFIRACINGDADNVVARYQACWSVFRRDSEDLAAQLVCFHFFCGVFKVTEREYYADVVDRLVSFYDAESAVWPLIERKVFMRLLCAMSDRSDLFDKVEALYPGPADEISSPERIVHGRYSLEWPNVLFSSYPDKWRWMADRVQNLVFSVDVMRELIKIPAAETYLIARVFGENVRITLSVLGLLLSGDHTKGAVVRHAGFSDGRGVLDKRFRLNKFRASDVIDLVTLLQPLGSTDVLSPWFYLVQKPADMLKFLHIRLQGEKLSNSLAVINAAFAELIAFPYVIHPEEQILAACDEFLAKHPDDQLALLLVAVIRMSLVEQVLAGPIADWLVDCPAALIQDDENGDEEEKLEPGATATPPSDNNAQFDALMADTIRLLDRLTGDLEPVARLLAGKIRDFVDGLEDASDMWLTRVALAESPLALLPSEVMSLLADRGAADTMQQAHSPAVKVALRRMALIASGTKSPEALNRCETQQAFDRQFGVVEWQPPRPGG